MTFLEIMSELFIIPIQMNNQTHKEHGKTHHLPKPVSQASLDPHPHPSQQIQSSLLDITYPYYHESMLAKSKFYGFQCLLFESGIYFSLMYIVTNLINKGYVLKWDILQTITSNLIEDLTVISSFAGLSFMQMYVGMVLLRIMSRKMVYGYCLVWLGVFVGVGLYAINTLELYFTDRIFIVVVSWALPAKTASFCIDQLPSGGHEAVHGSVNGWRHFLFLFKFIISPKIIYSEFVLQHSPKLKIHGSYLLIKLTVALMCLLVNYILLSEIISPLLQPEIYGPMSFFQLFFRLIPPAFYINICLYYLIMENILLAMAELTQLRRRVFYEDWWNAKTVSQFLDKWVLLIGAFSNTYLGRLSKRVRHACNLSVIFLMLFSIFANEVNKGMVIFAGINIGTVFFFGENTKVQNNYLVHFMTISFTSFSVAAQLKYSVFQ